MSVDHTFLQLIKTALVEDIGTGDISAALVPTTETSEAVVMTREDLIVCGQHYFNAVFQQIDPTIQINWFVNDADSAQAGTKLCSLTGHSKSLLTGERTALNFLQTLSGTATMTHKLVELIRHTNTKLLDTRKTIPGLRQAQKYAVVCGGGVNHRMGLYDAFLIKENHIRALGSLTNAVKQARALNAKVLLEVEVENFTELAEALANQVPRILLDNFNIKDLKKAVEITAGHAELEASGNISEKNIIAVAETGVNFISVGKITKDIKAIDLSMRFENLLINTPSH